LNPQLPDIDPIEFLKDELGAVLQRNVDAEIQQEKTWQFMRLRKCDLYLRGLQYLAPVMGPGGRLDYMSVGQNSTGMAGDPNVEASGLLDYNIDIIKGYCRKFVGSMGTRAYYNMKCLAEDNSSEADRDARKEADKVYQWLLRAWNIRLRNVELFYHAFKSGTRYIYHPFAPNADLFGTRTEPILEPVQVEQPGTGGVICPSCGQAESIDGFCPQCQVPMMEQPPTLVSVPKKVGERTYANSGPMFRICTGMEVTVPFDAKTLADCPFLVYEYDEHPGVLLQLYGQKLREQMDPSTSGMQGDTVAQQQGSITRAQAQSLSGMTRIGERQRWLHSRIWLTPPMYELFASEEKRAFLREKYPSGVRISRANGKIVGIEEERLNDVWTAMQVEPSDYLYNDPFCWGILGQQDLTNDFFNLLFALSERKMPMTVVSAGWLDLDKLNSRATLPTEMIEAKAAAGQRLQDGFHTVSTPQGALAEYLPLIDKIDFTAQQHTGLTPPVFGANEKDPTAEGARLRIQQALMQNAPIGELCAQAYVEIITKCVRLVAEHGEGLPMVETADGPTPMFNVDKLRAGRFRFEAEIGVPMSWAEKTDMLGSIIKQNPEVAAALDLDKPYNAAPLRDYLLPGMNDLKNANENYQRAVNDRIQKLLKGAPTVGPDGTMIPSIPVQQFVDDNLVFASLLQQWCNDESGLRAADDNPQGFANVVAHGMAQLAAAQPPAPPLPPEEQKPEQPQQSEQTSVEPQLPIQ